MQNKRFHISPEMFELTRSGAIAIKQVRPTEELSKRNSMPQTQQKQWPTAENLIPLVCSENKSLIPSVWLGPVARQRYTEKASKLVKHEHTGEQVAKHGVWFDVWF